MSVGIIHAVPLGFGCQYTTRAVYLKIWSRVGIREHREHNKIVITRWECDRDVCVRFPGLGHDIVIGAPDFGEMGVVFSPGPWD